MTDIILRAEGLSKHFGGTHALKGVDFELLRGEVHALIGQNGAGKSTFSRIVCGDLQRSSGKIYINGVEKQLKNSIEARREGISMVYQELRLIPSLSVTENILLNSYLINDLRLLSWAKMHKEVQDLMERWEIKLNPKSLVADLSVSKQQIVEILRNLYINPKVLIMDEPTSALGYKEIQSLFNMINYIKKQGVAIVYISHVLDEVFTISDRVTIFRDGENKGSYSTKNFSITKAVQTMLAKKGFEINENLKTKKINQNKVILKLKDIVRKNVLNKINLELHEGEILGIVGLMGSGKTDLARAIVGLDKIDSGEIHINQKKIVIRSIREAMRYGLALIPEDRRKDGFFALMSIKENITILILKSFVKFGIIRKIEQSKASEIILKNLEIKYHDLFQTVHELSGGNQQKVVIGKWLSIKPNILIADEPTRGIDVGTKLEIYKLFQKMADSGKGLIVLSEEAEEILHLADRILVFNRGQIVKEFNHKAPKEEIIKSMTGCKAPLLETCYNDNVMPELIDPLNI